MLKEGLPERFGSGCDLECQWKTGKNPGQGMAYITPGETASVHVVWELMNAHCPVLSKWVVCKKDNPGFYLTNPEYG
jgi:hypothetical protein